MLNSIGGKFSDVYKKSKINFADSIIVFIFGVTKQENIMKTITKVSDKVNSTMWAWGTPLYTLENKDYVCPFCSHGETIELHRQSRKSVWSNGCDFKYYLSCIGGCMNYDVFKISNEHFDSYFDKIALEKSLLVFDKMVDFSKNFTDYKKDIDFII